jgi:hypothetical protein
MTISQNGNGNNERVISIINFITLTSPIKSEIKYLVKEILIDSIMEETMRMPQCFRPITLRSGLKYLSLKKHYFKFDEVNWLCRYIIWSNRVKHIEVEQIIESICDAYNLETSTVSSWFNDYCAKGEFTTILTNHIDAIGLKALDDWYIKSSSNSNICEFVEFIQNEVQNTRHRREESLLSISSEDNCS